MDSENEKPNILPRTNTCNKNDDRDSSQSHDPGKEALPPEPTTPSVVDGAQNFNTNNDDADVPVSDAGDPEVELELLKNEMSESNVEEEEPFVSPPDLEKVSEEIDQYISSVFATVSKDGGESENPDDVPICVEQFAVLVEAKIGEYESDSPLKWTELDLEESASFLESIDRTSKLSVSLCNFSSNFKYAYSINRIAGVLQRGMSFLEEVFKSILLEAYRVVDSCAPQVITSWKRPEAASCCEDDEEDASEPQPADPDPDPDCDLLPKEGGDNNTDNFFREYPEEMLSNLNRLAKCMIEAGFEAECCRAYFLARRNSMEERLLHKLRFEKHSIDDVQKMQGQQLERGISSWILAFRECMKIEFPNERQLSGIVFPDYILISQRLFSSLTRCVLIQLLNFAEAVAMTKRAPEKLFNFLDVYDALRDILPTLDDLLLPESREDIKSETSLIKTRFGEASVNIVCELENAIRFDPPKPFVPGGAIHPITKYTMNYLRLVSTYRESLEQVFREHKNIERSDSGKGTDFDGNSQDLPQQEGSGVAVANAESSPFQIQLTKLMDSLHSNLEMKAKLYKDLSLLSIFMMNNGRYILQKVKGTPEINRLIGNIWCRKKSSQLRQYHKNYQRDTWGKALNCLMNHEGLNVNGKVVKPVLKERFKNFTAMFDEIHKTQSTWIVADDQLQSELRVSISNMVIPAYRAFLARYGQTLTPGRQTEKYVKYQPEDIETIIDELFDGGAAASAGRRKL